MTHRPLTLTQVAQFVLADLSDPTEGFCIDEEKAARNIAEAQNAIKKKRRRTTSEKILDEIDTEKQKIYALLRGAVLPDDVAGNPFYPDLLRQVIEEDPDEVYEQSLLIQKCRILPFLSRCTDIQRELEKINRVATSIVKTQLADGREANETDDAFQRACRAIRNALLMRLHDNSLVMDNHPLMRMDFGRTTSRQPHRVSTRKIRDKARMVLGKRGLDPAFTDDKACIEFVNTLLPRENQLSTYEQREAFLRIDMPDCLERATELYKSIVGRLQKAQEEFHIPGEQIEVDLAEENEYRSIVELIGAVVNQSRKSEDLGEAQLHNSSEAQTLATLAYLFYYVRKHPYYRQALAKEREFRHQFMKKMFNDEKNQESVQVPVDRKGNILSSDESSFGYRNIGLRTIHLTEWESLDSQRIYFEGIRRKKASAIVKKLLLNPQYAMEDLFDYLGGRVFLWDISRSDLEDTNGEAIKENLQHLVEKMGNSAGARLVFKKRADLKRGEFCIEDKIDSNPDNDKSHDFPVLKVYGIAMDGCPFEFQLVLKDGYNSSKSKESPNHEDFYEMEKDFRLARILFPEAIYPTINQIAERAEAALKRKKQQWIHRHPEPDPASMDSA